MTFLNPLGLFGLLSVPVIVGLHLHLERNRRVIVSSMFLWSFLEAKFEGQKPKYIQLSWLLVLDIMVAVFLSLAFAQPMVKLPAIGGQPVQKIILIDDSTSMLAMDGDSNRFSVAKETAVQLLREGNTQNESIIISFGGTSELVGKSIDLGTEGLINKLEGLQALGTGVDLRSGLALALSSASFDLPIEVYILTDAAFESVDIQDFPADIQWIFIGSEQNNQAVIDPALDNRAIGTDLFFSLANYSAQQVERDLEIRANQQVVDNQTVLMPPMSVQQQIVSITGEIEVVEIQLKGQDSLPMDDYAVLSNLSAPPVQVALVTDFPDPIDRAILGVPGAELTVINPLDFSPNLDFDLVIFRGNLPDRWPSGTVIVFDPPQDHSDFKVTGLETVISPINVLPHDLIEGVDLAGVRWAYVWKIDGDVPGRILLSSEDVPLMLQQQSDQNEIFFFLPQLSSGNFTKHPAFPIFLANSVEYARSYSPKAGYLLGELLDLGNSREDFLATVQTPLSDAGILIEKGSLALQDVGLYTLRLEDSFGINEYQFGVNAGEFEESNINQREWESIITSNEELEPTGMQMIEVNLSPWLLLVVVVLLVLEARRAWR